MSEPFNIQTGAVRLAPKQQYFNHVMSTFTTFNKICELDTIESLRVRVGVLVRFLIAYMPDKDTQKELNDTRDNRLKEAQKITDTAKRNDAILEINIDTVGKIMILVDQMIGVIDRQTIMMGNITSELVEVEYAEDTDIIESRDDE